MSEDILIPIPTEQVATFKKVRWHQVVIYNGEEHINKRLEAQAQSVPVRVEDGVTIRCKGEAERAGSRDRTVYFSMNNPLHLALMQALEAVVREADDAEMLKSAGG